MIKMGLKDGLCVVCVVGWHADGQGNPSSDFHCPLQTWISKVFHLSGQTSGMGLSGLHYETVEYLALCHSFIVVEQTWCNEHAISACTLSYIVMRALDFFLPYIRCWKVVQEVFATLFLKFWFEILWDDFLNDDDFLIRMLYKHCY
jgi:hypothetical protein